MNLFDEDKYRKCWEAAIKLLSRREYTEPDMIKKLQDKKFGEDDINCTLDKLKQNDLINDEEFVRKFIRVGLEFRHEGFFRIKQKLFRKGIDGDLTSKIWNEFVDKEIESAERAADSKIGRLKNMKPQEVREKLSRFLSSRGFSFSIVKEVISKKCSE